MSEHTSWANYSPPDLAQFVAEASLHNSIAMRVADEGPLGASSLVPQDMPLFSALVFGDFSVEAHCPQCGQSSIFRRKLPPDNAKAEYIKQIVLGESVQVFVVYLCTRVPKHELSVALLMSSPPFPKGVATRARWVWVMKIGQHPSLADMQRGLSDRAMKAIGRQRAGEFKRGVGLAAHSIGIGAFVYLRRIFESLVGEVAEEAIANGSVDREEYQRSRMDEKVGLLKSYLPPFMVENRQWYGIVSKGLHDLTEEECIAYFPVVRTGIEFMIEQKAERLDREERMKSAAAEIQSISAKLKP